MLIWFLDRVRAVGASSFVSVLIFLFVRGGWVPLPVLGVFGPMGIVVAPLTNRPFIHPADLFDTSELHHDQIVALLGVLGIVGAVWAELRLRRATRPKRIAAHT